MRKLILKMSMSLDGFVGGPEGQNDWMFPSMDKGATQWTLDTVWLAGFHVMGRKTFQEMVTMWPYTSGPFAAPMNAIPKLVFTRGKLAKEDLAKDIQPGSKVLKEGIKLSDEAVKANLESWKDPVVSNDLTADIARLKQEDGKDLVAYGGASFAQSLLKLGLVDEYRLLIHPVVLGRGLQIFSAFSETKPLTLLSSTTFPSGAVGNSYVPG